MDRRRAAGALLALAACIACSTAAPTASNQTALELLEGPSEGCYYNFQHYGEGDRIMTNEPCLNCTCHNRMLMCYLRVCPFTKPIGQDCTIEKRADQCCPIITCPDVPVDLLTSTSTSSPAEYGATGLGKVDKYGCSINGKYFSEGSKVPPTPNKPCEHCYCIRNMTTCVMQECTLHVDGCTPIYHKDVCCPVRYSCDHLDDEMLLLDDMTTTVRPTPGFLLTTTTMSSVTQMSQDCVHDDQIFTDGALIKTEKACEHCYCMKGDIVCVVQECGTPMENEGKNCTSLPPRQGQCCPDTYICEGDELLTELTTGITYEELTTFSPPRRVEGSGYRNEPDEPYTEIPTFEGSGDEHATTLDASDIFTAQKQTPQIIDDVFTATEESLKPHRITSEPDKGQNTVPDDSNETTSSSLTENITPEQQAFATTQPTIIDSMRETDTIESKTTILDYRSTTESDNFISKEEELIPTTESAVHYTKADSSKITEMKIETETTETPFITTELSTYSTLPESSSSGTSSLYEQGITTTLQSTDTSKLDEKVPTTEVPKDDSEYNLDNKDKPDSLIHDKQDTGSLVTTTAIEPSETTSVNPVENEIDEDILPPGRIPGEGDCLLNGITYKNNTNVPNINNCHSSCKCISSIVKCDPIICSPPPAHMENMSDCQPIYDTPDACCPTYVCHSRETIPPESHSQMSGTESPKPSSEKPELECHGEQCQPHENTPMSLEPCTSENCKPEMEDQDTKCKNKACDHTESSIDTSPSSSPPSSTYPEDCIGDTCLPTEEKCKDGKCQEPTVSETLCNNENGCQPPEACEGNNCVVVPQVTIPSDETSICKDSEACKPSDTSKPTCEGSKCNIPNEETQVQNEINFPSVCTEESCRRKEQPAIENKSPSECSSPSCTSQEVKDEPSTLTTESNIKEETYNESTTETIEDIYSKSPEPQETPVDEIRNVTQFEAAVTKSQDTSPEISTDKPESASSHNLSEQVTEKGESYSEPSESHTTNVEETYPELYNKQETEDHQTTFSDSRKPEEQVTESIEHITKVISTESPFITQYEEHHTELPTEEPHKHENDKEDKTEASLVKEFTETPPPATNPTNILVTTSQQPEADITGQEYTKKHEIHTESPEQYSTHVEEAVSPVTEKQKPAKIETQESGSTESKPDISLTESYVTLLPEIFTENYVDDKIKEDDSVDIPGKPITTEQAISVEQSSEPYEINVEETTATDKVHDTEMGHISTATPNKFTEIIPTETTAHEIYTIEEKPQAPETTETETHSVDENTGKESTESSIDDQQKLEPSDIYNSVTDKQDINVIPVETPEYITSVPSISVTQATQETQTHELPISDKGEEDLPESFIKESPMVTIPEHFDMKDISTRQPEIPITSSQELTTETTDVHSISLGTISDVLQDHTDTTVNDMIEASTNIPGGTYQEGTTHKDSSVIEPQEITTDIILIEEPEVTFKPDEPSSGLETTISSMLSDKNQEISTQITETEFGLEHSEDSTFTPEVHSTKLDESTAVPTLQTSTSRREESEVTTTESLKQSNEEKSETPDYSQTNLQTQEPWTNDNFNKETTEASLMPYTDRLADSDDKTVTVSIDESKTEEIPLHTTPETTKQYTDEALAPEDHVTKGIDSDITVIHSSEDKQRPTGDTISDEKEPQYIFTPGPETTTQDTETKLITELQTDKEISTTHKEEKGQTQSPMSFVTESAVSTHSDQGTEDVNVDKMTEGPIISIPDEEKIRTPDYDDVKPQMLSTEAPQLTGSEVKFDSETPSHIHPETESQPESSFTPSTPEYTTVKVLDILDKEKIPPTTENSYDYVSTEVSEKLAPTTELQDVTIKADSDDLHGSTSAPPVEASPEESFVTKDQEISTEHPDIFVSVTTLTSDQDLDTKLQNIPKKEYTTQDTVQPQGYADSTTPDSKIPETLKEDHEDTQQQEHTISPELLTTKTPVILDNNSDRETAGHKPIKQEENTLAPEQHTTTEGVATTEQTLLDSYSSIIPDQEKSTEVFHISDEKDITTPIYQDLTTLQEESMGDVPELHLSTSDIISDILTTESSEITLNEEDHRRTLSPSLETVGPDEHTTETQKITGSPEPVSTQMIEHTTSTQELTSNEPEKESATKISTDEEFEHITLLPESTEANIPLQTETIISNQNQELPAVTESIDENTVKLQDSTIKPDTELDDSGHLHSESIGEDDKDQTSEKTSVHDGLIAIPIDTMPVEIPSENTTIQTSQTEASIPKETEISGLQESIPFETETEMAVPIEMGTFIPEATEPSISKVTDITEAKVTEVSVSGATVPDETETSVPEVSKTSMPEVTQASIPEVTQATVPKVTEATILEETEASIPEVTKDSLSEVTQTSITEITEDLTSAKIEASAPEVTETVVSEVTDTSVPKRTESDIMNIEPVSTTYKPKDEMLETPENQSPTLESITPSSETTPYLVELQEHTTKVDEGIPSATLTEEATTKSPETYQTERGDQPFDNLPDKSTQEDFQEEHTTKEIFTEKDEQLPTLPLEQSSEYPVEIPHKPEVAIEEVSVSSESPMPTISDIQIGQQTESPGEHMEKFTTSSAEIETTKKDLALGTEKVPERELIPGTTASEDELIPTITKATTIKTPQDTTTHLSVDDKYTEPANKPAETYSPTTAPEQPRPGSNEIQPTEEIPSPDFSPSGTSGYGQEPDYVEEDQAFGPGTCRYGGKVYVSAQQIPRDDPCDFCFCFRSDIICLQQSCPPPIHGCHEEPIQGFCCPRYECPVSMATTLNVTTTTTTTTTTLPPHFLPHAYKGAAQRRGCQIKGHSYKVGEVVRASSGPCLHCTCGGDGQMKCDPKACTPEPMLRQMIAAAVSAKRRR